MNADELHVARGGPWTQPPGVDPIRQPRVEEGSQRLALVAGHEHTFFVARGQVFKTLVVIADGRRHLLVVTPGDRELDLRLVAKAVGAKAAHMALQRDAERLTGLKVGGISPLALLDKRFEVYLDAPAEQLDELYINGGQRGVNLRLYVSDLLAVTGAQIITATHKSDETA